jgi:tetratricopeptide (TPR) repeat protein
MSSNESRTQERYQVLTDTILTIAQVHERNGRWHFALHLLKLCMRMVAAHKVQKARLQARAGDLLWKLGEMSEAAAMLQEAQVVAAHANDKPTLALALYNLGEIYYVKQFLMLNGNHQLALDTHQQTLALREQINDQAGMAHSLSRLGVIYERLGDDDKAAKLYHKAIAISKAIDYPRGKTRPLTHIGAYERRQGDWPKALGYFERALTISQEAGHQEAITFALGNVGETLYHVNGDIRAALDYCRQALAIARRLDFKLAIARTLFLMGMLYKAHGDFDAARDYWRQTVEAIEPFGYQALSRAALKKLGSGQ